MEIRRIVYALLQAGLVEFIRPQTQPLKLPVSHGPTPMSNKEQQKSLINRLISRIRSL
jgi:hypothetical protein